LKAKIPENSIAQAALEDKIKHKFQEIKRCKRQL
jgi:hypothetical protein